MPPGVYGDKLLITVLFNRTQPLIRYELSDSVRLAVVPCPSGRPFALIDDIQGRVEDVLSFQGVVGGVVNVHPLVFSRIMDILPSEWLASGARVRWLACAAEWRTWRVWRRNARRHLAAGARLSKGPSSRAWKCNE